LRVAKKEAGDTPTSLRRRSSSDDASTAAPEDSKAPKADAPPTQAAPHAVPRKRAVPRQPKVTARRPAAPAPKGAARVDTILGELRGLKGMVRQLVAPPSDGDSALEESVDSLRRLLSELIERRMESVVKDLVDVRREAAAAAEHGRIVKRLDALLDSLGAVLFDAEPMDIVDPLIHVVVDERRDETAPDGVILETVQPGYRSARGLVLCKASVAVNRRA
jgi:hypothetical protein